MPVPSTTPPVKRTVLVTGAAKRLGREIALALARDGWQVAVHYRDSLEDATKTVADCARLAGASAPFRRQNASTDNPLADQRSNTTAQPAAPRRGRLTTSIVALQPVDWIPLSP